MYNPSNNDKFIQKVVSTRKELTSPKFDGTRCLEEQASHFGMPQQILIVLMIKNVKTYFQTDKADHIFSVQVMKYAAEIYYFLSVY